MLQNLPSANADYSFLVRNILLAWIPLLIAFSIQGLLPFRRAQSLILPLTTAIWILFFPNAPYLLTDLQHIRLFADSASIWFDVILLTAFAWTGLLIGVISLSMMHRIARREYGTVAGWVFVFCAFILASSGIYLGRFYHVNSWDLLQRPQEIIQDLLINDPSQSLEYIALYTLFLNFIYITFIAAAGLMHRQAAQE